MKAVMTKEERMDTPLSEDEIKLLIRTMERCEVTRKPTIRTNDILLVIVTVAFILWILFDMP